ncbi:MAG TPA: TlpA disulfide reductase family protein [Methylomirabilota bacterium]|nr:TlpA disulfide reductase family protein [Methylomirabilota bacterium]
MRRAWRWLVPLSAVPVLAVLAYGFLLDPRSIPSPLVGRPAAPFTLTAFDGSPVSLEAWRGKVVVVNFWASWCKPACYDEAPVLERAWRTYRDRGLVVVGVDMQDTPEAARAFIRQFQLSFPNAPDDGGKVAVEYGVYGVPETFFVDRAGTIRAKHVGAVTDEVIRATLEPLL